MHFAIFSSGNMTQPDVYALFLEIDSIQELESLMQLAHVLDDHYSRSLWHQLTLTLEQLYSHPDAVPVLKERVYTQFVGQLQRHLNPVKVVDFLLASFGDSKVTLNELIELRAQLVKRLTPALKKNVASDDELAELINAEESIVYVDLQIARYHLLLGDKKQSEDLLDTLNDKFADTASRQYPAKINAAYYLTKSQLHKIDENYNQFYTNGLLYLSSVETDLSADEKVALCYDLCIAALLGDKIYNFGELILHEILSVISTEQSPYHWLHNLIQALNSGDLQAFNAHLQTGLVKSPFLAKFHTFLQQKIIITSFLELISRKSTTDKRLTFQEINEFTGTPVNDVEHLIIKCFSLNLIKGYINQIDEVVVVTWLQPRILSLAQVKTLYDHLVDWDTKVEKLGHKVHAAGGSVWAGV